MIYPVIIFGCTGLGRLAANILQNNDVIVHCFVDDEEAYQQREIDGILVLAKLLDRSFLDLFETKWSPFVALEDPAAYLDACDFLSETYGKKPLNAIHKEAYINDTAHFGQGNLIDAKTVLNFESEIKNYCQIQAGTIVERQVILEDFVYTGIGALINAKVHIEKNTMVGAGSIIYPNVRIGHDSKILPGSIVKNDLEPHSILKS